ncbi:DinB family protein [bacterium]|nr:DinB family protein [bacterium]
MDKNLVIRQFMITYDTLNKNLSDISDVDGGKTIEPLNKSVQWLVGHLLAARQFMHSMVSLDALLSDAEMQQFTTGSGGTVTEDMPPLSELVDRFKKAQRLLFNYLKEIDSSALDKELKDDFRGSNLGEAFHFHAFHEAYHIGQLGLMRRLLGKDGMIG